ELSALLLARDRLPTPAQNAEAAAAGRKVYDGELRVGTILREWQLDADLVVLSACQTGLGRYAGGDGLLGFAHAFLQKGARAVVLSRWKVDDAATALLMQRFYANLLSKRFGRAQALAEAKKWLAGLQRAEAEKMLVGLTEGVLKGSEKDMLPLVARKPDS